MSFPQWAIIWTTTLTHRPKRKKKEKREKKENLQRTQCNELHQNEPRVSRSTFPQLVDQWPKNTRIERESWLITIKRRRLLQTCDAIHPFEDRTLTSDAHKRGDYRVVRRGEKESRNRRSAIVASTNVTVYLVRAWLMAVSGVANMS